MNQAKAYADAAINGHVLDHKTASPFEALLDQPFRPTFTWAEEPSLLDDLSKLSEADVIAAFEAAFATMPIRLIGRVVINVCWICKEVKCPGTTQHVEWSLE